MTEADGSQVTYGYDALHRLTSEVRTGTNLYNVSYGYDPAGNRLNKVLNGVGTNYTYDNASRLLTADTAAYSWDAPFLRHSTSFVTGRDRVVLGFC